MKFTVNKPCIWMYKTDDLLGEVSDELLFGTVLEIVSENDTTAYCKTDYGYCGYINKWELCECETEDCDDGKKQYIYSRCDILYEPCYRLAPCISLPKGARIRVVSGYDERFSVCLYGNKRYYIPNYALNKAITASFREEFVSTAQGYIGTPYRWGGKSDNGIDCSGLAFMCARLCGKMIYRDAIPDERYVKIIEESSATKGDLIYFKGHIAIICDEGKIIHASAKKGYVISQTLRQSGLGNSDIICYASLK